MKKCVKCDEIKSYDNYHRCSKSLDGLQSYCTVCANNASNLNKKANNDKMRQRQLNRRYNISIDIYNQMLNEQGNVCFICENSCKSGKNLSVDHSHKTGLVRKLLCTKCNVGLGYFEHNFRRLIEAAKYVKDQGE